MGFYDSYLRAEVVAARRLTPTMVRIRLGGDDLVRFTTTGVGDERLVVVFPAVGEREAPAPLRQPDGTHDYADGPGQPVMRSYTVRTWDRIHHELEIDFVVHGAGVATAWAVQARPGDAVYLTDARGWYRPPDDAAWQVLVADLTGLPAVGRIVEALPAGVRALVIAEVPEAGDRQEWRTAADVEVRWLVGSGHGRWASGLLDAVRELTWPTGPGYLWFAGEAGESRGVRRHLRSLGWTAERYTILGYWRRDAERWLARYEEVGRDLEQVYADGVARGLSSTEALELYDDALEQVGL